MILQALNEYYQRLLADPEAEISEPGFSSEKISAVVVINSSGKLVQFKDIRNVEGKRKFSIQMKVPQSSNRSGKKSHEFPFFLWDNTGFVLGKDDNGDDDKSAMKFDNFKEKHRLILTDSKDSSARALLKFLDNWVPDNCINLDLWEELVGKNLVFQIDGEREFLHDKKALKDIWLKKCGDGSVKYIDGICSITNQKARIPNIHPVIKGVRAAHPRGVSIISFNQDAFCSYGKEQNYNAPVGESIVFAYTTALNYLLNTNKEQKIQIGDATTVFWTERESPLEGIFGQALDPRDTELSDNKDVLDFLEAARAGKELPEIDPGIRFYILGLSPNGPRVSVRFWHVSSVGDISKNLGQHFSDLQIIKDKINENSSGFPGMWRLLNETTNKKSKDGPPPLLAGEIMRSILQGVPYPQTLLSLILNRIRAEQAMKNNAGKSINSVNYLRASLIKAILVRKSRFFNKKELEVTMALDTTNKQPAYLLGRLFAVLEKAQQGAIPGANATIKDRYYGSASATPRAVFPQLLRLTQHHIQKAEYGYVDDKRIEEIIGDIQEFPAHLTIDQQGLFAIGYYHQRQELFKKKEA